MTRRMTSALLAMVLLAQTALCDWHHHGHGSGSGHDPGFEASMWTCVIILVASLAILFLAGPILVIRTRRIRDILWLVPLINVAFYVLSISLRPYPGGFAARCEPAGFANTVLEIAVLLGTSLIIVLILAVIRWGIRLRRRLSKTRESDAGRNATDRRSSVDSR